MRKLVIVGLLIILAIFFEISRGESDTNNNKIQKSAGVPAKGGVKVIHIENHDFDYVAFKFIFRGGSLLDPESKEGLANLTARMLLRGTANRSYEQLTEEIDHLGSSIACSSSKEAVICGGDSLKRNLRKTLEILEDVLLNANFPADEFKKEKALVEEELKVMRNADDELAMYFFGQFLYRGMKLGMPNKGSLGSLKKISRDDCVEFYRKYLVKENLIIAIAGAASTSDLDELTGGIIAKLPQGEPVEEKRTLELKKDGAIDVLIVDKPDRTQTQIVIGHPTLKASDPDYFPMMVGNNAFGGTFTARLMREIREKRGWSYGAFSFIRVGKELSTFVMRFYPATKETIPAIELALNMLKDVAENGLKQDEVDFSKSYLINRFPFKIDTPLNKLREMVSIELLGQPQDYLDKYVENVKRVELTDVNRALKKNLSPSNLSIVIVGTAKDLEPELRKLNWVNSIAIQPYNEDFKF